MKDRGQYVRDKIKSQGFSIGQVAKDIKKTPTTLSNYFKNPQLPWKSISKIGDAIGYDFSKDYPELITENFKTTTMETNSEPKKRGRKPGPAKNKEAKPKTENAEKGKRGRKPKAEGAPAVKAEKAKRGRKPKSDAAPAVKIEKGKRGRKPKAEGSTAAAPAKRGRKPKAAAAPKAAPAKRGRKPKAQGAPKTAGKRGRKPKELSAFQEIKETVTHALEQIPALVGPKKRGRKKGAAAPKSSGNQGLYETLKAEYDSLQKKYITLLEKLVK